MKSSRLLFCPSLAPFWSPFLTPRLARRAIVAVVVGSALGVRRTSRAPQLTTLTGKTQRGTRRVLDKHGPGTDTLHHLATV